MEVEQNVIIVDILAICLNSLKYYDYLSCLNENRSYQYRNPPDKMVSRPCYLYNKNHIPGKMAFILKLGPDPFGYHRQGAPGIWWTFNHTFSLFINFWLSNPNGMAITSQVRWIREQFLIKLISSYEVM